MPATRGTDGGRQQALLIAAANQGTSPTLMRKANIRSTIQELRIAGTVDARLRTASIARLISWRRVSTGQTLGSDQR